MSATTLITKRSTMIVVPTMLLATLTVCIPCWCQTRPELYAQSAAAPAPATQPPRQSTQPHDNLTQGEHESFLTQLPDGDYVLPAGRFYTAEDRRRLAATPDIKVIHRGPPGTLGYFVLEYCDPVANAEYERVKLRRPWNTPPDPKEMVPNADEPQRLMILRMPGRHESFLCQLPNREYMLPIRRAFTKEDFRLLMSTPDVKIVHRGTPDTITFWLRTDHFDPAVFADSQHRLGWD